MSARYYYSVDEQGSTDFITDSLGDVKNEYWYDAFGNVLDSKQEVHNRITYTGQQFDNTTQQYYLRVRFYNPVIGRFTQEDVYRGDGLNLYAYCGNNPVGYCDPSGYIKQTDYEKKFNPHSTENKNYEESITIVSKKTTGGEKKNDSILDKNLVQRGVTPEQAEALLMNQGILKPKPPARTTPTQHVGGTKHLKDPWTSTSRSDKTAEYYATHDSNGNLLDKPNPIIEIDLNKIDPENIVDVSTKEKAQQLKRPFCINAAACDKEVLIKGDIPSSAINRIIYLEYK